jgi:hypothetical protein
MTIAELMQAITNFDCQPNVFCVFVQKHDYETGFTAVAEFRSTQPDALRSISAHDDDPQKALEILYAQLTTRFGKCPACGEYRHT